GFTDFAASVEAGAAGHVHVEEHEVWLIDADFFERIVASGRLDYGVTLRRERGFHHAPHLRLVVHYQNGRVHHRLVTVFVPASVIGHDRLAAGRKRRNRGRAGPGG